MTQNKSPCTVRVTDGPSVHGLNASLETAFTHDRQYEIRLYAELPHKHPPAVFELVVVGYRLIEPPTIVAVLACKKADLGKLGGPGGKKAEEKFMYILGNYNLYRREGWLEIPAGHLPESVERGFQKVARTKIGGSGHPG